MDGYLYVERDRKTNIPLVQNAEYLNIRTLTAGKYIYHLDLNG